MKKLNTLLTKIPYALSSKISVFIFVFLFVYLFIFGLIGLAIKSVEPSATSQLIFGNYTNVLSALGAALAAGGTARHSKAIKELHKKHDVLLQSLDSIHHKLDDINKKPRN